MVFQQIAGKSTVFIRTASNDGCFYIATGLSCLIPVPEQVSFRNSVEK